MISARRFVCLFSAAALAAGLAASPASAQGWLDNLLGRAKEAPPAAPPPSESAPAPAPAPQKRAAPATPRRPASGEAAAPASPAVQAAVAPSGNAAAPPVPLSEQQAIVKANAYFNGLATLVADFTQVGADGRRLGGKLSLQRPGKLRFEYDEPSTLEVIADGGSVAVRDRKLATQDLYAIGQTPLKFLLREKVDLARDVHIAGVESDPESVRIALEDRSTLGGTSKITLHFDRDMTRLTRWRIIDPQGFQTTIALANIDRTRRVDQRLFVINYERMLEDRK